MRKFTEILLISALASMLAVGSAFGFGTDITIFDENGTQGIGDVYEDNEAEPGMVQSAAWDLEGFFLDDNNILTMVGTYDFKNGEMGSGILLESGDVFIDVDGDAAYGDIHRTETVLGFEVENKVNGNTVENDTFGYDYVLDMDFEDFTYDVYRLTEDSYTITSYQWQNQGSNPWQYHSGGDLMASDIAFGYQTGLSDAESGGFDGWGSTHNAVTGLDLNIIDPGIDPDFVVHFTMECGNDNLMGQGTLAASTPGGGGGTAAGEAPEPATMLLLGSGLAGLAGLRRKYGKKS
jgi:hypothetical protein